MTKVPKQHKKNKIRKQYVHPENVEKSTCMGDALSRKKKLMI